jgi:SAM-dependent methyltransferase
MSTSKLQFTGEFMVPGKCEARIEEDHQKRYNFAARYCTNKRILDVACGCGYGSRIIATSSPKYYLGIDINCDLVENAISEYGDKLVDFKHGSITDLDFNEQYDVAICFETIEHVNEYQKAIASLFDALVPGGLLLISSPNRPVTSPLTKTISDPPGNPFHTQEFTPQELKKLLKAAGFDLGTCKSYGQRLSFRYFLPPYLKRLTNKLLGDPSYESSPWPRRYLFRQPAYFVLLARKSFK